MTKPDNFILRWARLKRQSDTEREVDASHSNSKIMPKAALAVPPETAEQPWIDATADEPFDPSSLPSIEEITATTDVRAFLESRVPAELTRAALRQVWTSDPAIRDFIGIAENQWDFNDPNAIPGFGPLEVTGNEPAGLISVVGRFEKAPGTFFESSASEGLIPSSATDPTHSVVHETSKQKVAEWPSGDAEIAGRLNGKNGTEQGRVSVAAAKSHDYFRNRRHHGGASPH